MRSVEEWIGKNDDTPVPPRVRLRIFDRDNGRCHLSGRKIRVGEKWELEHIVALCNGGEHRETNLAPALVKPHKAKTAQDRKIKAKDDRVRKKNSGIKRRRRTIPGRKFDGTPIPSRWVG
jgi:5-methylcytosine-specific restriction endonuclease McrA